MHVLPESELQFKRELEIALRVSAEVSGRVDDTRATARRESAALELADETIGVAEIDVVKEVYRLNAELAFNPLCDPELLEERCVRAPVARPAQRVALLTAKSAHRRGAEHAQIGEEHNVPLAVARGACLHFTVDIRTAVTRIRDATRVKAVIKRQAALKGGVRINLPSAEQPVGRLRNTAQIFLPSTKG